MKKLILVLLVFASIIYFNSCGEEDIITPVHFQVTDGAYILSEGTSPTNSALSFYSVDRDTFYKDIYNGNLVFSDGIEMYNGDLLVVEQGAFGGPGKLYQLDSNGGLKRSSNPFGTNPYSIAVPGQRAYITNGPSGKVSVIDLNNLSFMQDITVGVYPQEILFCNGSIYVCNISAFGGAADSTVSVINPNSNTVVSTIVLRKDPTSIKCAEQNNGLVLYAGCQGGGGIIYKIEVNTHNKLDSFNVPNGFDKDLIYEDGAIYFISGSNNIDKLDLTTRTVTTFITNPGSSAYFYGYNYDNVNKKHYVLDAKTFTVDGSLYIYSQSGILEKTFVAGVGPRRVYFKKHSQ